MGWSIGLWAQTPQYKDWDTWDFNNSTFSLISFFSLEKTIHECGCSYATNNYCNNLGDDKV